MIEVLTTFCVWRICVMLMDEIGPFEIVQDLRNLLNKLGLNNLLNCNACLSIWVALPFSFIFPYWFLHWMGFSAGAMILDSIYEKLNE